jgi:hypothetical protein
MCSNFATRMQEARLHENISCMFLLCFVSFRRVRVFMLGMCYIIFTSKQETCHIFASFFVLP